jgi:hypothetical protein
MANEGDELFREFGPEFLAPVLERLCAGHPVVMCESHSGYGWRNYYLLHAANDLNEVLEAFPTHRRCVEFDLYPFIIQGIADPELVARLWERSDLRDLRYRTTFNVLESFEREEEGGILLAIYANRGREIQIIDDCSEKTLTYARLPHPFKALV